MDFNKQQRFIPNPAGYASFVSRIFFFWVIPLFGKGFSKDLEIEDLYTVLEEDQSNVLGNKLERHWKLELEKAALTGRQPSLTRALIKFSWRKFTFITFIYIINQCILLASQPVFLRLLIATFNVKDPDTFNGWIYAGCLTFTVFLSTITNHPIIYAGMQLGMKLRVALSTLVYRKTLRLSKSAQNETNPGQIVNILSNDCSRFDLNIVFLPFIVTAPIVFVTLIFLLYKQIGLAALTGIVFVLCYVPLQYYIGKYSAVFRLKIAKRTDERGKIMNEIIVGMRVIKQYAWEKPFSVLVRRIRRFEVTALIKRGHIRGVHLALQQCAAKLVQYLAILAFFFLESEPMTSDKMFFTLSCLHIVCQSNFTPQAATAIGEMKVAIDRIQHFLQLDEHENQTQNILANTSNNIDMKHDSKSYEFLNQNRISMNNVCASWTRRKAKTLENISFSIESGTFVIVVGPVGSSKSSLLQSIIKELPASSGEISVTGSISYCSQEPWIFGGSIRQNILFGLPYDQERYRAILNACALVEDIEQLQWGDLSVVGERGVALSGGQKARVNLARALYRKADIYLIDDPLSAVDTRVSHHIFEKCFMQHLKGSTRILVTHQVQYLPQADHIIVLEHGKIVAQGCYEHLVEKGIDFMGIIASNENTPFTVEDQNLQQQITCQLDNANSKIQKAEDKEEKLGGSVTSSTYWEYFTSGHSVYGFITLLLAFTVCQIFMSGSDWWLSFWTNAESSKNNGGFFYIYIYTGLTFLVVASNLVRVLWFFRYCATISSSIHDGMFQSLVPARIKFFDENPSGRIMNRFMKDLGTIDELLPPALADTIAIFLNVFGVLVIVIISNYYMSVPTLVLFGISYLLRKVFVRTSRDLKRIESIAKSPVFTHVTATLQGLTTIRASGAQNILLEQFEYLQDTHSATWFIFIAASRWFGMWLELISDLFLTIVTFSFLLISSHGQISGGNVGLAISSLLSLMSGFQWGMRQSAEAENFMTSVERAQQYQKLEPEASLDSGDPPSGWPHSGQIQFCDISLSYEKNAPPVLTNLNFEIKPCEKIGIVGRTGAGKSSMIAALFRLAEPEGKILIDNVNIKNIGLHELRKNISIIPQDPVLFSGTVRYNLDPFGEFIDSDLCRVIEDVGLTDVISSLDHIVEDGGCNFSVGQKQLLCLARAILRKNKILVLDEATANLDYKTDHFIQQAIRQKFANCTIITVAHRLHSIIDCDRVLILDHGAVKEFNHSYLLLQNENGLFYSMVMQTQKSTSKFLYKQAEEAFKNQYNLTRL